jgi:hypothetical protein
MNPLSSILKALNAPARAIRCSPPRAAKAALLQLHLVRAFASPSSSFPPLLALLKIPLQQVSSPPLLKVQRIVGLFHCWQLSSYDPEAPDTEISSLLAEHLENLFVKLLL